MLPCSDGNVSDNNDTRDLNGNEHVQQDCSRDLIVIECVAEGGDGITLAE